MRMRYWILICSLYLLLLVNFSTAEILTINDVKVFNKTDITQVTIKESALGQEKVIVKLNTPLINAVGVGYVKIAEFDVENIYSEDLQNFFNDIYTYNRVGNGLESTNKPIDIKYKTYFYYDEPIYNETCLFNSKIKDVVCQKTQFGTEQRIGETWTTYNSKLLMKGQKMTIGLFTNTTQGEKGEWIPRFQNTVVNEWAGWNASWNTNMVAYYDFDEASGNLTNIFYNNATMEGVLVNSPTQGNTTGVNPNSYKFTQADTEYVRVYTRTPINFTYDDFTINFWYLDVDDNYNSILGKDKSSGPPYGWGFNTDINGSLRWYGTNGGATCLTGHARDGTYKMITLTRDNTTSTGITLYLNGVPKSLCTGADYYSESSDFLIGYIPWTSRSFDGNLDELAIWNGRALTQAEITALYNGGSGEFYSSLTDNAPTVTLQTPANATVYTTTNSIPVYGVVTDDIKLDNVTFYLDGVSQYTNTSGINNSNYTYTFTGLTNGWHNWTIAGTDNSTQTTTATVRWFNISATVPTVNTYTPVNGTTTNPTNSFVCGAVVDVGIANVSLIVNGSIVQTNSSVVNNTNTTFSYSFASGNGLYIWNCQAQSNLGLTGYGTAKQLELQNDLTVNVSVPDNAYNTTNTSNITFIGFVSDDTQVVNVSFWYNPYCSGSICSGTYSLKYTNTSGINATNYTFSYAPAGATWQDLWYIQACDNLGACVSSTPRYIIYDNQAPTVNITWPYGTPTFILGSSDAKYFDLTVGYGGALSSCWYSYNGANTTVSPCLNSTLSAVNNTFSPTIAEVATITVWANDSLGNTGFDTETLIYYNYTIDWDTSVIEGDNQTITVEFTSNDINSLSGNLSWNGTSYTAIAYRNDTFGNLTYTLTNPATTTVQTIPIYFDYIINNVNTETYTVNQTLGYLDPINVTADECNDTSLIFYSLNEVNLTNQTADMSYNIKYGTDQNSTLKSAYGLVEDADEFYVCINSSTSPEYIIGQAEFTYFVDGFTTRNYYINNLTITNDTQEINLYSLESDLATSFIVSLKDSSYFPIDGAYISFNRWYPNENLLRTIAMVKTDVTGNSVVYLEEDIVDYAISVNYDGDIIYQTSPQKVYCTSTACSLNFVVDEGGATEFSPYGDISNFEYSDIAYNETSGEIYFTYTDTSGTLSYVRLVVNASYVNLGEIEICETNSSEYSTTLYCNVSEYNGDLRATVYVSRSPETLVWAKQFLINNIKSVFGFEGLFWAFMIMAVLAIGGAVVGGTVGGIIGVITAFIFVPLLGIASFGAVATWGIIILGVFLIWNLKS